MIIKKKQQKTRMFSVEGKCCQRVNSMLPYILHKSKSNHVKIRFSRKHEKWTQVVLLVKSTDISLNFFSSHVSPYSITKMQIFQCQNDQFLLIFHTAQLMPIKPITSSSSLPPHPENLPNLPVGFRAESPLRRYANTRVHT